VKGTPVRSFPEPVRPFTEDGLWRDLEDWRCVSPLPNKESEGWVGSVGGRFFFPSDFPPTGSPIGCVTEKMGASTPSYVWSS